MIKLVYLYRNEGESIRLYNSGSLQWYLFCLKDKMDWYTERDIFAAKVSLKAPTFSGKYFSTFMTTLRENFANENEQSAFTQAN